MACTTADISVDPVAALREQFLLQLNTSKRDQAITTIRLDEPFNLYLVDDQAELYLETIATTPFERQLYRPLVALLQEYAGDLIDLPAGTQVDFIDLGPGLPDKSLPLIDYVDAHYPGFRYVPVDISSHFLEITTGFFRYRQFPVLPQRVLFEELSSYLRDHPNFAEPRCRIVNIGLTFNNFEPAKIARILSDVSHPNGIAIIATESIDRVSEQAVVNPYCSKDADTFNFRILELLGFERQDFQYYAEFKNARVEMGFIALRTLAFNGRQLPAGSNIRTSISYRYHISDLRDHLLKFFRDIRIFERNISSVCAIRLEGEPDE